MQQQPNIVLIMADDMGFGDVGCYGASKIPTPHMDRLADEGMVFMDAHAPSAVCTPTRYGVMTGRYCWRTALKHSVLFGYEPPLIEPDRLTVASLLKSAGYQTACVGKWHLGLGYSAKPNADIDFDSPLPWPSLTARELEEQIDFSQPLTGGPTALGFDYFFGTSGCSTAQPPYSFIENEHFVQEPNFYDDKPVFTSRPGMTVPDWDHKDVDPIFARKAVEYVEHQANSEGPFFLMLTPSAPHEPCMDEVVPEFARRQTEAGSRGDLVWLVDWMVGQVVDALERSGQADNTLILVTSDNGALPGDRVLDPGGPQAYHTYDHKSCGDWRGYKSHIWEGGHRVPLIAKWTGHIPANSRCEELICLTDVLATVAAIVDVPVPEGQAEDSVNMLSLLTRDQPHKPVRDSVIHHSEKGVFSLRSGQWKLIADTLGSGGWVTPADKPPVEGNPGQLYHIEDDPFETNNLWEQRPDIVTQLLTVLDEIRD